jgi:hypothetical protein
MTDHGRSARLLTLAVMACSALALAGAAPGDRGARPVAVPTWDPAGAEAFWWLGRRYEELRRHHVRVPLLHRLLRWAAPGETITVYVTVRSIGVLCLPARVRRLAHAFAGPVITSSVIEGDVRTDSGFDLRFGEEIEPAGSGSAEYRRDEHGRWKLGTVSEVMDGWLNETGRLGYVDAAVARYDARTYGLRVDPCRDEVTLSHQCAPERSCTRCESGLSELPAPNVISGRRAEAIGLLGGPCVASCPPHDPSPDELALIAYQNRILEERTFVRRSPGPEAPAFFRNRGHCLSEAGEPASVEP